MKNNDVLLKQIGEKFGSDIVVLVMNNRAFTVTIIEVDDTYAYVSMTGSTEKHSVPLTCTNLPIGYLKVKPKVDSIAIVTLANSMEDAPFFLAFSDIDELTLTVGEMSVKVNADEWRFNGGDLGGLVVLQKIVDKLNAIEDAYNDLVIKYNTHIHAATSPVVISPTTSTETTILTTTKPDDIKNDKILQ